jgi:hypothetical protein
LKSTIWVNPIIYAKRKSLSYVSPFTPNNYFLCALSCGLLKSVVVCVRELSVFLYLVRLSAIRLEFCLDWTHASARRRQSISKYPFVVSFAIMETSNIVGRPCPTNGPDQRFKRTYRVHRHCPDCLKPQGTHSFSRCVNALSWAREGELLLSGGDDKTCVSTCTYLTLTYGLSGYEYGE